MSTHLPFFKAIKWGVLTFCSSNYLKGGAEMLNTELEIISVGTPDFTQLTDSEQEVFFETLYARVLELAKKKE